jgi:hypothetical protein
MFLVPARATFLGKSFFRILIEKAMTAPQEMKPKSKIIKMLPNSSQSVGGGLLSTLIN